jgi:Arc/MetJ-type ribon-helix-helix transcriptional regulator
MLDRITVRMTTEMIARIDAWIAEQPGYVSRQEAVRRLVEYSLERGGPRRPDGVIAASHQSRDDPG